MKYNAYTCCSFIARVENTMHKVCFVLLVGCTLIMCFIGYYSIMVCLEKLHHQYLYRLNIKIQTELHFANTQF